MKSKLIALLLIFVFHGCYSKKRTNDSIRKFPSNFMFGAATSAYQIEGAWNESGKSENIWDHLVHSVPSPIVDNSTGDVAADAYHLYKEDVDSIRQLGLDFYRFSLSWTRILPTSFPDYINQAGVDHYNNLIDELLKYNIQPLVTIYHWDLPQKLQNLGGWANPDVIEWYADYARIVFELFGDRVKYWITINEPQLVCYYSYAAAYMAPRFNYSGVADYMCAKNLLLAHAKAYHIYDEEFRASQGGSISLSIVGQWYGSQSGYSKAAEDSFQFHVGIYAHPIFSKAGGWPSVMVERVAAKSKEQGFPRSRLPPFTRKEKEYVRGTADFYGLNHYTTFYVYRNKSSDDEYAIPSTDDDLGVTLYQLKEWSTHGKYVPIVPWGMYKILMKIKKEYDNPPVLITENGYATGVGLDDEVRVEYYRQYLAAVLDAIAGGARVRGYTAWSLLDNFEWIAGYTQRFGLYQVDFANELRPRTPRKSAFVYKEIVRSRELDPHYNPNTNSMTIDDKHALRKLPL